MRGKITLQRKTRKNTSTDKKPPRISYSSSHQKIYVNEMWLNDNPLTVNIEDLEEELQNYFKAVVVILYFNMEEEGYIILNNLQKNQNVIQLVPHFVDFFCKVIDEFKDDFLKASLVFKFIEALLQNPHVYFGQDSYLNILFCSFFKFLVADLQESNQGSMDCWSIKDTAANILPLILEKSKYQHLYFEGVYLVNLILASEDSLNSWYGALATLNALGVPAILQLLPLYIEKFYKENEMSLSSNRVALLVQEQIIYLYYVLVDYYLKNEVNHCTFNLTHDFKQTVIFPDYLKNIEIFPVLSNIEETLSRCAGEVLLPVKARLLNFQSQSMHETTKQNLKRKKKCLTNYPLLLKTII